MIFNNNQGIITFSGEGDMLFFRGKFEEYAQTNKSIADVSLNFIARKSTCTRSTSRRLTSHLGAAEVDEPLDQMKAIDFEVQAYKHKFFGGWQWAPY